MVGRFLGGFVWLNLVFCIMVGRLLVGFVWLNLQFFVSWQVDFQRGLNGSIFSFLCHGRQTFSGVRVAQSLVFCVMVGRLLVGFEWLNLQFSVSWLVDFQWDSCGSNFSLLCHDRQTFSGVRVAQSLVFCVMVGRFLVGFVWLNLVFCIMVGRLLVGFVWLNLQFSVSWQVDFQRGLNGSIFSFLCHGRQTFSWVRVAQSLVFCVMVGRLLVGFEWPNLQFSVSWLVDISVGFVWLKLQSSVSWQVDFQWGSCGSIFSFLCHGWQTFSGVRVAHSLLFRVMVGRLLVGFVWLNLYFSVSWLVDFSWDSYGSIFSFLRHGRQTFSGVRVPQSLVFCVMVGRLLVVFVWLNLQFSMSWQVDFQWGSCGSIFSFPCHGWQTFSGVRVAQSSFLYHGWQTFSGVRVAQCLVFCVMVGRLLAGFEWLNLQFSVSRQVDFQWGSCGSIFSFLCHGRQTFSGVRVAQSLVFCVMVGRLSVGFVWLKLQSSVSWQVDFQWGSCGSIFSFLRHGWLTFSGVRVAQSLVLCHGWQIFSGVRVTQSLVFCVMVDKLLLGFVWFNLQFSVS